MPAPRSSSADAQGLLLAPGQQIDRYVVDAVLGAGGTATVYKVHHANLGTPYALKVLSIVSPSIRRRTLQEGKLQARMNHRNIVAVYDVFEVDGAPGLLMEYVEGPSLETALSHHRLTLPHAEAVFRAIVDGVRQAHQLGLVHRDLKPANVLLAETSQGVIPKVTDFGIAKAMDQADSGQTRAGIAMGTPQYMSPEQIRDARSVDRRADIFSLGCLLYELVTGQRTFPHDDIIKVYNHVCDGVYRPPRELAPHLPERIVRAIRGALTVDREARIPDCETLLAVFEGRQGWGDDVVDGSEGFAEPARGAVPDDDPWAESATDVRRVGVRSPFVAPGGDAGAGGTLLPSASLVTEEGTFTLGDAGVAPARAPFGAPSDAIDPLAPPPSRTPPVSETWIGGVGAVASGSPDAHRDLDDPTAALSPDDPDLTDPVAHAGPSSVPGSAAAPAPVEPNPDAATDAPSPPERQAMVSKTVGIAAALAAVFGFFFLGSTQPVASGDEAAAPAVEAVPAEVAPVTPTPAEPTPDAPTPAAAPPSSNAGRDRPETPPAPTVAPRPAQALPLPAPSAAAPAPLPSAMAPTPVVAPILAPSAPPAPPAPTRGRAILNSVPSVASVTVDGNSAGMTPLKVELAPGKHRVTIKSGDESRTFSIDVTAGVDAKWCYVFDKNDVVVGTCPR
jgi:hypothetical protein